MLSSRTPGKKNYELVAEQIRNRILQGEIQPGERLESVEQLAKRYEVGRSTIREALSALRAMGWVEIRQGDGTFASDSDLSRLARPIGQFQRMALPQMLEFFEVRKIIESGAATLAAVKRRPEHLDAMKAALEDMENVTPGDRLGEIADANFHLAIAEATLNGTLAQMMHQISGTLRETMQESRRIWLFSEDSTLDRLYQEHAAIYQAIEDQNPLLAQQLMLAHLTKVENVLIRYYRDQQERQTRAQAQPLPITSE